MLILKRFNSIKEKCRCIYENGENNTFSFNKKEKVLLDLFNEYSRADVLAELKKNMYIKDAINFFKNISPVKIDVKKVQTIGVFYWRMYNGGVEKVLASCLKIWNEMGYRVVLYTDQEPSELDYEYPEVVKRVVIPPINSFKSRLSVLEKSIVEEKIDVFINNAWMPETVLWELILIKSYEIPYILYTHGDFTFMYNVLNEYAIKHAEVFKMCDLVLTLTKTTECFYNMLGCNTKLVYNPVAEELLNEEFRADLSSKKILWIGRIAEVKRPQDAIYIYKKVKEQITDAELEIVGTGERELIDDVKQMCDKLGVKDSVHFRGYQTDVKKYYKKCSMMLMTSEMEGYPTVLLESKAYGVPCVMYELPCTSLLEKGILSASIGDQDKIAEYIIDLLKDEEYRYKLGRDARESFEYLKNFNFVDMWEEIFKEVVNCDKSYKKNQNSTLGIKSQESIDSILLPMFVKQLERADEQARLHVLEYKIGNIVLEIPRRIKKILKRL